MFTFLHPFFFLLLRVNNFNCPILKLAASFFCLLRSAIWTPQLAIAILGDTGSSSPDSASGHVPHVFTGHSLLSPFAGYSHFFWIPLSRPANCAAPAHPRLPPGSSPASPRSYLSSWYRHSFEWYSVERTERRSDFLRLNLLGEYQSGVPHVSMSWHTWWNGICGVYFFWLSLHTHTLTHPYKIQTQIKVWRHIFVTQC